MENLTFYSGFVVPFIVGVSVLFAVIAYKYVRWTTRLPRREKLKVRRGFFSAATVRAAWECVAECLLHRRIWRVNPLLGYMHTSFALGWALLIVVGWMETAAYLGGRFVPLQGHIFFKFFTTGLDHGPRWGVNFEAVMDLLLLYVLSGLALAMFKRLRSKTLGMKRTTRLTMGDRIALGALWFVFPMRLLAESVTSGVHGSGGFLTGGVGAALVSIVPANAMGAVELASWWGYSIALGVFFVAMPFSRYMHIFTEVPLIFLRHWGVRSRERETSFDHFQLEACSRCGLCLDVCPMQTGTSGLGEVQSVYFVRDRRYNRLTRKVADTCLMCGRCGERCPVGLELNALRLNSRHAMTNTPANDRYGYARCEPHGQLLRRAPKSNDEAFSALHNIPSEGRIGYFAGCMTLLSPRILRSMERIFAAAGEDVTWLDRNGGNGHGETTEMSSKKGASHVGGGVGICCGRPQKLSGEVDAAREMMRLNTERIARSGITTLVTSCPICLRVFREEYTLPGVEVIHHSEYFARLMRQGRIAVRPSGEILTWHDPCELGRGCGIYDAPREVISSVGRIVEPAQSRENGVCCGGSIAGLGLSGGAMREMASAAMEELSSTGAAEVVTGCPLCKKTLARTASIPVVDLSELVARQLT